MFDLPLLFLFRPLFFASAPRESRRRSLSDGLFDTSGTFYGTSGTYLWRGKLIAPRGDPLCDAEKAL